MMDLKLGFKSIYTQAKTVLTFQIIQIVQGGFTKVLLINTVN